LQQEQRQREREGETEGEMLIVRGGRHKVVREFLLSLWVEIFTLFKELINSNVQHMQHATIVSKVVVAVVSQLF